MEVRRKETASGLAGQVIEVPKDETARQRLERLERDWRDARERKRRQRLAAGPHLRWAPPVVERLTPAQRAVFDVVLAAPADAAGDSPELMHVLSRNEPDVNFTYCGQTPLFVACNRGKRGVARLLLRWPHPSPIDAMRRSDAGETPLLAACRGGHLAIARLLLAREDVDPDARANDGRSALWCACHAGHAALLRWFLDNLKTGYVDWETAAQGLEGFDPPRTVGCAAAARARGHLDVVPLVEEGVRRQRAARAKARFKRAQRGAKVAVRMRDADGVFFGTDAFDNSALGELHREKHTLGNEEGIDFGGHRKMQADMLKAQGK